MTNKTELDNEEIERTIDENRAKVMVVGCGGAGGNTISRIMESGIKGAETLAINTDAQDLLYTAADKKILIGREITGGLGAGNDPETGANAADSDRDLLKEHLHDADLVFVTCGLGGGTGTGSSPIVAEIAQSFGALTIGVVTLPFNVEGRRRGINARRGLEKLRSTADTTIIIPDDNLLKIAPDLPLASAFGVADRILMDAIKGITEIITEPGLINLDFADIVTILRDNGIAQIGVGEADGENRALKAVEEALYSPLLETDVSDSQEALVNIVGDQNMTLEEAKNMTERISQELGGDGAEIVWGAHLSNDMRDRVRVMIVIPDARTPWADGPIESRREEVRKKLDLEIRPVTGDNEK